VIAVVPDGVEKTHPFTEATSLTFKPIMVSGVRVVGKKLVAVVVSTVILKGAQIGGELAVAAGGTKKAGRVLRVKLNWPALIAATEPVIWLGSSLMLFVVKVVTALETKAVALLDPLAVVTDP